VKTKEWIYYMAYFLSSDINLYAIAILLILLYNIVVQKEKDFQHKIFIAMILTSILVLVLDTFTVFLDGKAGVGTFYWIVYILYFIINPIPCYLWMLFIKLQIHRAENGVKRIMLPFLIPIFINAVLTILSLFTNLFFYIDSNNIYHRGKFSPLFFAICFFYLLYALKDIVINKNKIRKNEYLSLFLFVLPPVLGSIAQAIFYGTYLTWPCMVISLLIVFINIQYKRLDVDYLTGLFNKRQLDVYLNERIRNRTKKYFLAGIMIDINEFKKINDTYGHLVGDKALEDAASILLQSLRKNDFVARYGGDEFAVILELNKESDLIKAVGHIKENVRKFNFENMMPYRISFSIGYDIFSYDLHVSAEQFLHHIDQLMYIEKENRKKVMSKSKV
jgi:diguanylate cyclase (GGDEF)-like protein